jgi:alpha-ketoglutarate-dependent taurine dioxygenase
MEVCKNKSSGQYFIFIRNTGANEALLVTPKAEIKSLNLNLFADIEDFPETYIIENNMVTEEQIIRLAEYKKDRTEDITENLDDHFEQLSPHQQEIFIKRLEKIANKNKT